MGIWEPQETPIKLLLSQNLTRQKMLCLPPITFNSDFRDRVAFLASSRKPHGLTTDRTEFLGRMGDFSNPAALGRIGLASAVNAGLDPCAAIQLHVDLSPGSIEEVYFLLGEGATKDETLDLIKQNQNDVNVEMIWESVHHQWDEILGSNHG